MKITSPVKGYSERTEIGPYVLEFKDGVAEFDGTLNKGAQAYLKEQGYGLGSASAKAPEPQPEPLDPRSDAADVQVGTKTRDAAVDPLPGDFLAPTNAGEANPHGPKVVSPEIHASQGVRPVKGGDVFVDDPEKQDAAEKAHTVAATDGTPVVLTDAEKPATGEDAEEGEVLKGAALDDALEAAGLPKSGSADEKRARLNEHNEKGQG